MSNRNNQRLPLALRLEMYSNPEPNTGCTLWSGPLATRGYGHITEGGKTHLVHRLVWERANGQKVPAGLVVRHRCDNVGCVNPEHLLIGTQAENVADRELRGRGRPSRGERNGGAKLTIKQVLEIRSDCRRSGQIAKEFGISALTVWEIRTGRKWRHVGGVNADYGRDKGGRNPSKKQVRNAAHAVPTVQQ